MSSRTARRRQRQARRRLRVQAGAVPGATGQVPLTPRQRRRARHKENHARAPFKAS